MSDRENLADSRFACTRRERAIFEAGIKMGTIYHQFVGTPFNATTIGDLERTMERTIGVQPYVTDVSVRIDRSVFDRGDDTYSYVSLTGEMIDAKVTIEMDGAKVTAEMRYDPELDYPLMYISSVE
ncbi:MAG: dihydroneopterin aldolase family protein [Candidatus Methanomethylophilaceae archaeon]